MIEITALSAACVHLRTFSSLEGANCTGQTLSCHVLGNAMGVRGVGGQNERGKLKCVAQENSLCSTPETGRKVLK